VYQLGLVDGAVESRVERSPVETAIVVMAAVEAAIVVMAAVETGDCCEGCGEAMTIVTAIATATVEAMTIASVLWTHVRVLDWQPGQLRRLQLRLKAIVELCSCVDRSCKL